MAVPPGSCPKEKERNLGPLHEPVWLELPPERSPLDPVPSVIIPPRAYQMGMARVPGPLHDSSWEPQAETSSLPGRMPSTVTPAGGGTKWKGKSVGPLHEPVWDEPPLSGPVPLPSLPPGCTQKGKVTQGDPHKPPFLAIPPCFCEKGKGKASYPASSRTTVACTCQPTAAATTPSGTSEKGKDHFLHPPHDPVWFKLPLGSTRLEASPPKGIPPVSCLKEREKPPYTLQQQLPLGSSHLVQPPSVAVPPCICLKKVGGLHQHQAGCPHPSASSVWDRTSGSSQKNLGPLHEPVWNPSQASTLQGETPSGSVHPGPLGTLHEPVPVDQPDSLSFQGQTPLGSVQLGTLHEPVFCHFPGGTVQIQTPSGSAQHEGTLHESSVYYHYPGGTVQFQTPLGNVQEGLHEPVHHHVPGCPAGQGQTPQGSVQQGHRGTLHEPVQRLLQTGSFHVGSTPVGSVQKGKHSSLHEPVSWD